MPHASRDLDVRSVSPALRYAEVVHVFETLGADEAIVLLTDEDPKPLLLEFQTQQTGRFEWSTLEAGPGRFRVQIRRRTGETLRTVSEYLEQDHRRLDEILPEVDDLVGAGEFVRAAARFAEFSCGLNHHIDAEEGILFPSFESLTGMTHGPTVVMRAEHVEIRRWMASAATALAAHDAEGYRSAAERLVSVLVPHNMKEERILYPMSDEAAGPSGRDTLVRRMQLL